MRTKTSPGPRGACLPCLPTEPPTEWSAALSPTRSSPEFPTPLASARSTALLLPSFLPRLVRSIFPPLAPDNEASVEAAPRINQSINQSAALASSSTSAYVEHSSRRIYPIADSGITAPLPHRSSDSRSPPRPHSCPSIPFPALPIPSLPARLLGHHLLLPRASSRARGPAWLRRPVFCPRAPTCHARGRSGGEEPANEPGITSEWRTFYLYHALK